MSSADSQQPLWQPSAEQRETVEMARFMRWAGERRGHPFADYEELWRWSTEQLEDFWASIWEFCGVRASKPYERVLGRSRETRASSPNPHFDEHQMPGTCWFEGAELNYAENLLARGEGREGEVAVLHCSELRELEQITWGELTAQVAGVARGLRALGVQRGDRVVAYMPNIPETLVAFLAVASIGAIWSSAAPEFGARSVVDRFAQIEPKVLLAVDGYRHGGKDFDRRAVVERILAELPTVEHVVTLSYLGGNDFYEPACGGGGVRSVLTWGQLLADRGSAGGEGSPYRSGDEGGEGAGDEGGDDAGDEGGDDASEGAGDEGDEDASEGAGDEGDEDASERAVVRFEQVPFDHPLWVLYSSGTTGLPKAIVQGHGGILVEQLKKRMHLDLRAGDRMFWFTTTGWMMWNFLVGCLNSEAAIVLYDGSPAHPDLGVLWAIAERTKVTCMGLSAGLLASAEKAGVEPAREYDLSALRAIGSTGSPLAPESFRWVYEHVKSDVWLFSTSGGTDVCTAFVAGCPLLAVYEGELQCRALGCAVAAWDERGQSVVDEVGELVITEPMPSMPLYLWGDADGSLLHESYFAMYPGVWRHGDWLRITPRGGAVIYGRSDSTINRQGVRMGTSEIYRAASAVPEVLDALVVDIPKRGGDGGTGTHPPELWMAMFVVLREGVLLDEQLAAQIKRRIREDCSPRHVPNEIRQIEQVPRTLSGKVLEVPVKRILMGMAPEQAASVESLANPHSLDYFVALAAEIGATPQAAAGG